MGGLPAHVGLSLVCLGGRQVRQGEKYVSLSKQDKLHCMVMGMVECLQQCSDLDVDLPEISHLQQQALEEEVSKELILKSPHPLLSLEEQMVFSTTMLEGVSSKFGIKPDRRESLLRWLCRVIRLLQHNGVRWQDNLMLQVATDPHCVVPELSSWLLGTDVYSKLRNCKAMELRVGAAGANAAVVAALAAAESDINQLQRRIQDREHDKRSLLQGSKQEKKNKKQ